MFPSTARTDVTNSKVVSEVVSNASTPGDFIGVGVDQGKRLYIPSLITFLTLFTELMSSVPSKNPTFLTRNFTEAEITNCNAQPSPPSSFAAPYCYIPHYITSQLLPTANRSRLDSQCPFARGQSISSPTVLVRVITTGLLELEPDRAVWRRNEPANEDNGLKR